MLITSCEIKSLHTRLASVSLTSMQATEQPAEANACAVTSPRPLPAPVTRTTFPFNLSTFIQVLLKVYLPGTENRSGSGSMGLAWQACKNDRQADLAPVSRNKHINECQNLLLLG